MSNEFPAIEVVRSYATPGLHLEETVYPGGLRYPRHMHEPAFLTFFLAGGVTEHYSAGSSIFQAPALAYHPPGEVHAFQVGESGLRALTLEMMPEWTQRVQEEKGVGSQRLSAAAKAFAAPAARLLREFQAPDRYSGFAVEGLALEILAAIFRCAAGPRDRQPPRWLLQTVERLQEHFRENLRLDDLAAEAGVHPVHLSRTFSHHYQCTIGEYIRQLRAEYVCDALERTNRTLGDIALDAGFTDQSQLCRQLRAHTGLTPSAYRRVHTRLSGVKKD